MNKKKVCFIAQFPLPMHGLSKAVETLYNSKLAHEFDFEEVDITNNNNFLKNLILIYKSKADLFYFTISQTKGGNLRDLMILKLLRMQGKNCVVHLHGGYFRQLVDNDLSTWQMGENYKEISKLNGAIVLGNSLKSNFQGMLPTEKIFVVPNCVDDEYLMSDAEFSEKIATISSKPVKHVMYLSNFIRTKGYPEVLEFALAEKKRCEIGGDRALHFDFAGKFFKSNDEDFFFEYIKKHNLEDYVTYHGIVGGKEKQSLLQNCDIFTLLTRYPNEGQPISILEAMGNGMMIITTDHAGIPDIVENEINGIVADKNTINSDIYDKLLHYGIDKLPVFANINRHTVINKYREERYVMDMVGVFQTLCNR